MFKKVFIPEESGYYNVEVAIADRIIFLQNQVKTLEATNKFAEAEKLREKIYDIMDKALYELDAYPIEESEVA